MRLVLRFALDDLGMRDCEDAIEQSLERVVLWRRFRFGLHWSHDISVIAYNGAIVFFGLPDDLQYPLPCVKCSTRILLPNRILLHILGDLEGRTTPAPAVAFVCPHCKQVQRLLKKEYASGRMGHGPDSSDTELLLWPRCGIVTCKAVMPLYALWSPETTAKERRADIATWVWDGLACPEGHPIRKPAS